MPINFIFPERKYIKVKKKKALHSLTLTLLNMQRQCVPQSSVLEISVTELELRR